MILGLVKDDTMKRRRREGVRERMRFAQSIDQRAQTPRMLHMTKTRTKKKKQLNWNQDFVAQSHVRSRKNELYERTPRGCNSST